eukprot:CAMPEP_0194338298 /NCGR_PEP_ID=MMETSP0171-20130528/79141_1 /TAXON_ID=218684 /ORGANISM="Corethron pennatum, Strain L29A3" /LENGTH=205 /DNA_ID=CAMNT_0039102379 /DNA_START=68 /DNA_END=685 /DNA_ORIENTATION=+
MLPDDLLKMVLKMLPASNRFIAPVCRQFRDLYGAAVGDKTKNDSCRYSISSEAALRLYLDEGEYNISRKWTTSYIGAGAGRIDWVERGGLWNRQTFRVATKRGRIRVLKWLVGRGCDWDAMACCDAAGSGCVEMLRWMREEGRPWVEWDGNRWKTACDAAAEGGHFDVVRWAIENGCPYHERQFEKIADLSFLTWFEKFKNAQQV